MSKIKKRIENIYKFTLFSYQDTELMKEIHYNSTNNGGLDLEAINKLNNNQYYYIGKLYHLILTFVEKKYGFIVNADLIATNDNSFNLNYSNGLIVLDDNFERFLVVLSFYSNYAIFHSDRDLKYRLVERLKNILSNEVKLNLWIGNDDYSYVYTLDSQISSIGNQMFWTNLIFMLSHEVGHAYFDNNNFILDKNIEAESDKFACAVIDELVHGTHFNEFIEISNDLLLAPAAYFLYQDLLDSKIKKITDYKSHPTPQQRIQMYMEYFNNKITSINYDVYVAHKELCDYLVEKYF